MLDLTSLVGFGAGQGEVGAHLFWRIYFTGPATGSGVAQAAEIEMRSTVGGPDQCNGGAAIASGYAFIYYPSQAFNNSVALIYDNWSSGALAIGGWIGYWFAAPVSVAEFYFYPANFMAPAWPSAFALEYSDDGVTWIRVKEYTGLSWVAQTPQTFRV